MIFRVGDSVFVAPDAPANRIGVYDYESWEYYNLSETIPKGISTNISSMLTPYSDHIIQIKVLQDDTERNFHVIKKTGEGGIVEGAQGDSSGSSFYSWYSSLYTSVLSGDRVFIAADNQFDTIKIHDYTFGQWDTINLGRRYARAEVADVSSYLQPFVNRMVQIQVYEDAALRNFHLVKMSPRGGIVEGGYPDSHSSFGSWSNDMYMLFRKGDRLIIAPTDYIDTIKVYDYTDDQWHTIALENVYPKYSLVDVTPYISEHEGHFIQLQAYYQTSQKSFHTIKTFAEISYKLTASIISPSPGQTFTQGQTITFVGRASGGSPPYAYNWTSSIDGNIGNNSTFNRHDLAIGIHNIYLTVTDSTGLNDTKRVIISVIPPDITPPVITNITAVGITINSAIIRWDTDELSDSLLKYGTESEKRTMTKYNANYVVSHSFNLTGLRANATYHYVVNSTDKKGNSNESARHSFATPAGWNVVYFAPAEIVAPSCKSVDVEIWINGTNFQSGQINLTYNSSCANVTNWKSNTAIFTLGGWDSSVEGREWITFTATSPLTGEYKIGTLTIHCISDCECTTELDFVAPSALFDEEGTEITANWVDGKFRCMIRMCGDVAPYPEGDWKRNMGDVVLLLNHVSYPGMYPLNCSWSTLTSTLMPISYPVVYPSKQSMDKLEKTIATSPALPQNEVYLNPQNSNASYCENVDVEIWINGTNFQSGQINLTYDSSCVNITNWERNSTIFPMGGWDSSVAGKEWITFLATSPLTGEYKIGTLTVHCISNYGCITDLDFVYPSALFDPEGIEIYVDWKDGTFKCMPAETTVFDTGAPANPYPSIMGNHTGTIKTNHTVIATKLYTYPCTGTGGHTEYAEIRNETGWNATAYWNGYVGDWHNITFDKTVVLLANETYNYTIITGSYPQIHHTSALLTANGWINCTSFTDANGRVYYDWIPAIKLQ